MAKLIPGKSVSKALPFMKLVELILSKEKNNRLYARVAEEELRYSLEDDLVLLLRFSKRGATVCGWQLWSIFSKNDERGQEILQGWKKVMKKKRPLKPR